MGYRMAMNRDTLAGYLFSKGCAHITLPDGKAGYVDGVQREDGSGRSFNLTVKLHNAVSVYRDNVRVETNPDAVSVYVKLTD